MRAGRPAAATLWLACSALKQLTATASATAVNVRFVHLAGDVATIAARLAARRHRYMPATLLATSWHPGATARRRKFRDPQPVDM